MYLLVIQSILEFAVYRESESFNLRLSSSGEEILYHETQGDVGVRGRAPQLDSAWLPFVAVSMR